MKGHITRGRAAGTWYLRVELQHDGNGKRRQRRETMRGTKADAQRRLRDLLGEIEAGGYADAQRMTVTKAAQLWLATKEHRVAAKTYAFYASHLRLYIVPALGSLRVESLRPAHIEAAIGVWTHGKRNDREEGELSSRSVAHLFNTLRTMLRWAVRMRMLAQNAADAIDPPRFEAKEMHVVDAAGVTRLLRAAQETDLQAIVAVAIGTGLRRGELLALRWSDVDLDQRRLAVRRSLETVKGVTRTKPPKTARSARTIALPLFVADILREEQRRRAGLRRDLGVRETEAGWVFLRSDGSAWEPGAFSLAFARFVKRAKLPHIRFHDLRHSFGTLALASGVDLQTVSRALGHESTAITSRIYLHAIEALQEDAAARIDVLLGDAVASAIAEPLGPSKLVESVPQRCHATPLPIKNARRIKRFLVAPTGIEPVYRGPGRSRRIPESPFLYGFSHF
jgi:integrase